MTSDPVWDLLEEMASLLDHWSAPPPGEREESWRPLSVREAFRKLDELRAQRVPSSLRDGSADYR